MKDGSRAFGTSFTKKRALSGSSNPFIAGSAVTPPLLESEIVTTVVTNQAVNVVLRFMILNERCFVRRRSFSFGFTCAEKNESGIQNE